MSASCWAPSMRARGIFIERAQAQARWSRRCGCEPKLRGERCATGAPTTPKHALHRTTPVPLPRAVSRLTAGCAPDSEARSISNNAHDLDHALSADSPQAARQPRLKRRRSNRRRGAWTAAPQTRKGPADAGPFLSLPAKVAKIQRGMLTVQPAVQLSRGPAKAPRYCTGRKKPSLGA